jgi:hypothetical protein
MKALRSRGIRTAAIVACIISFLIIPARLASNGLGVLLLHSGETIETPAGACPMCAAAHGGECHCPCCQGGACSCSLSSGHEEDSWLVLILESAMPPDDPEILPELPSAALGSGSLESVAGVLLPVPKPPPRS